MIDHIRLGWVRGWVRGSLATAAIVLTQAQPAFADAVFDFEFESFAVAGSVNFADDFENEVATVLVDQLDGTVTLESEGVLIFSDSDGSAETIELIHQHGGNLVFEA